MKNLILTLIITLPLTLWGQGWEQTFGGENSEIGYSVQQTTDGGYIITGFLFTNEVSGVDFTDIYLIKTDENGNEQWSKIIGSENSFELGRSVQQTTDGGFILIGSKRSSVGESNEIYLIKTDENGNEHWSKTFGGEETDIGHSVQQTTDGGFIITGMTWSFGNDYDVYLIKTDGNGNELWSKTFGGTNRDEGYSVQQTTDGGYIITGYTKSFGDEDDDFYDDVYLIKTDGGGIEQWSKTFGDEDEDNEDYYSGYSVQQTNDGGYIITGDTGSFGNGGLDVYLIKTDDQGNITSTYEIPLPNPNRKLEKTVNLKGQEIKPQTNQPIIEIFDDGSVEKKLIIEN